MNKIYKVIYSKVKQCYIVVSELAKSHVKSSHGSNGQQKAALTAAVLLALGTFSVASVFMPITAEAADKTRTDGSNFVGVERTNGLLDESKYENSGGKGAQGADSITLGLKAQAGAGTITIGDRNAAASLGSVYVGQGDIANPKLDTGGWATSIGYNSDATGYGSIALGSNAVAKNSYAKDSKGESLVYQQTYVENGEQKVRLVTKPDIQRASVAIGYGASADNGNIAIGSYSDASTDLRTAKTKDGKEIKSYLTDKMADSYVSVGDGKDHSETQYRRISNVADGASASDVATVGQLQELAKKAGVYKTGFGIEITSDTTTKENTIKLSRNLGRDMDPADKATLVADESRSALVLGGRVEEGQSNKGQVVEKPYGAFGQDSVVVGGANNIADKDGAAAVVIGGTTNTASAQYSTVAGGNNNDAFGNESSVFGGFDNDAFGGHATLSGGSMNRAYGEAASVFGGSMNSALGASSVAVGGLQSTVNGAFAVGIAGGSTNANHALAAGNGANVTVENGTAIGYQATTDEAGTIAFGHDAGDAYYSSTTWPQKATKQNGKYYDANNKEISKAKYDALKNSDGTWNDYSKTPTVVEKTYDKAAYNRLVKVADGKDDHDVVVMEQLKPYTKTDASNIGNNLSYKADGTAVTDDDKTINKNAWGAAIGTGVIADPTNHSATNGSQQLVTGGTVYTALQNQKTDLTKDLSVSAGWGISVADEKDPKTEEVTKNVISLRRNLGTNYGVSKNSNSKGKVTFETQGKNSLILGGSAINDTWYAYDDDKNKYLDYAYGTFQDDSVLVGGVNNATGSKGEKTPSDHKGSVVVGGAYNIASGNYALISGGSENLANGERTAILGGYKNEIPDRAMYSTIVGGTYNIASGIGATAVGGGNDIYRSLQYQNKASGSYSTTVGGEGNEASGDHSVTVGGISNNAAGSRTIVIGGFQNKALTDRFGESEGAIVVGGRYNINNGDDSVIFGGNSNLTNGNTTSVMGGAGNVAAGTITTVGGGLRNVAAGVHSAAFGGYQSFVGGQLSTGIAGGSTANNAYLSLAAGYQSVVTNNALVREGFSVSEEKARELLVKVSSGEASGYYEASSIGDGEYWVTHYKNISTALGYQATADESGTIALGHDKGDTLITYKWPQKAWKSGDSYWTYNENTGGIDTISEEEYQKLQNSDGTWNDYTASPTAVTGTYDTAYYNRLVKAADGENAHDAVVMEQLKPYTKSDASNIGSNLKTYTVGEDGETITEADATEAQKKANENAWGAALGTGKVADPNATGETSAENNGSQQLVTGGTVFNETRISAKDDNGQAKTYNYLNANNSAGKNLEVLDSALKTVSTTAGAHTALTVEGNTPAGTGKDAKTNEDVYAGKNILLHESTDGNGKVTYDLKLAKDINIGKPGKDGEDGKIGIDGKDGHIGLNGSDGITVRGLDGKDGAPGKDGVTITGPQGEAGKDGINGKVGISGTDGKDAVSISGKDGVGHIGLTGPAGTNGKDGASIDITVKNGYDKNGVNGAKGVDGKDGITRIVYEDKTGEHQVATMEDGMKYAGDDAQNDATKVIAKKLNNTLDIIGGADSKNLTEGNIGVNSTKDGKLKVQLAKDLTGITSISNQTTTKVGDEDVTTGAKITFGADGTTTISGGDVNVNGGKITHVGSGADASGNYTTTTNAANIGDVQKIVKDAVDSAAGTTNKALAGKANVDASNIGANLKGEDGKTPATEEEKTKNENAWGSAIGTGKIEKDNGQLVTGKTVYDEVRPKENGSYVKKDKTTGENLSALDTQVKSNADAIKKNSESIQNITNNVKNLSDNAVQYDKDSNKTKVTLAGKDGTTITNVKDGALSDSSSDAVNGKQLYNEQEARKAADQAITEKVTNNTNEITNIKNGNFTDASKKAIHNIAKGAVKVVDGENTTVTTVNGTDTTPTTYAVNVKGTGTVASGNTGLISGGTLYNEVHVDKDGTYIKSKDSATGKDMTVAQNLSALDSGLKTTSDLIHTNTKGDTIQIGGNSTATKIDVSGEDAKGNKTGRVITGVVSDASDPNSAANVGYVNGITSASNEQIYRDMNMQYNHVENDISRAAAGSNALAALHPMQEFDPDDKAQYALGYGHYRNSNAGAVGVFYQPDENSLFSLGASFGNGDAGINAGVTFKFGPGGSGHHALTKTQMAKVIDAQSKEIDALKKDNADKDKRIDALEQKVNEILAKVEKDKA